MKRFGVLAGLGLMLTTASVSAGEIVRTDIPNFPISSVVSVPAGTDLFFLSGVVPPVVDPAAEKGTTAVYGDTQTQTVNVLKRIEGTLSAHGLALGDVIQMTVFLVGDPAKGGSMDFTGMMAGYTQFFGTPEQPNKPARSTVQVASLVVPGMLVEIEVVAAKAKP